MADPKVSRKDYYHIVFFYIRKSWFYALLIAGALAVLGIFGLPSGLLRPDTGEPPAYRWDDPALESFSGMVRILDSSGTVRYRGWVTQGAYTGKGQVYRKRQSFAGYFLQS